MGRRTTDSRQAISRVDTGAHPAWRSTTPTSRRASNTCGAIPSPQHLSRGKSSRSSSRTRSAGSARNAPSAALAPAGPAPTTTRSHVSSVMSTRPSRTTSTSAIATAARNGARPLPRSATGSRAATRTSATRPPALVAPAPTKITAVASASSTTAHPRLARSPQAVGESSDAGALVVLQVGQHVEEVGADAQQGSGSDLPQRRPHGRLARQRDEDGQPTERHGVRQPRPRRRLQAEVVGPASPRVHQVHDGCGGAAQEAEQHGGHQGGADTGLG